MSRLFANSFTCVLIGVLSLLATAQNPSGKQWIGTWATAPQPPEPGHVKNFRNQTLRLILHISTGGTRVRIKISNTFGDHPLVIGGAHIARRKDVADIDPKSDRTLTFAGKSSTTVAAGTVVVSDPVALEAPALSDLAVSLFLPVEHRGEKSARSGLADELCFPGRGRYRERKVFGGRENPYVAVPNWCGRGGLCARRSHRRIWLLAHGWRWN